MAKIEGRFEKKLEVKTPLRLEVRTGSGDIEVRRGDDGRLNVSAEFEVRAASGGEAEELARRIEQDPPIQVEGNLVRIGDLAKYGLGRGPLGPSAAFDFSISAPAETEAVVSSGSGDQDVCGLKGPVKARAGSGDVQIEDIDGEVTVDVGSGDISVARVRSSVSADAGHGDVEAKEITGPVSVKAGSGDVSLHGLGGSVQVSVGRGDVSLESPIADNSEWALKTASGDVSIVLPRDSRFKLNAVSVSGEIETDFEPEHGERTAMKVEGQVGQNATSTISIKTAHGDIEVGAR